MSEQHTTSTPEPSPAQPAMMGEFKKMIPGLIVAGLMGFGTSYLNTQKTQSDTVYRLESLEKKAETNAQNIAQNSGVLQQNAIRIAEMTIIQTNTLEQIKDVKQEQADIKAQLRK